MRFVFWGFLGWIFGIWGLRSWRIWELGCVGMKHDLFVRKVGRRLDGGSGRERRALDKEMDHAFSGDERSLRDGGYDDRDFVVWGLALVLMLRFVR